MKRLLLILLCFFCTLNGYCQNKISIENIYSKGTFRQKSINEIRSMKNGDNYCVLTPKGIELYEYKTGKKLDTIVEFALLDFGENKKNVVIDYIFSKDEKKILLAVNPEFIYRYSYYADYYIFEIETKNFYPLNTQGKQRLADFSPDGKHISWIRDNNLFVTDLSTPERNVVQITKDGKFNEIIYGTSDWVYEEELSLVKG
ncbi:MAG: DPP IV N-terminal domain-containing protein, partial [Bacteroidales bacterium]